MYFNMSLAIKYTVIILSILLVLLFLYITISIIVKKTQDNKMKKDIHDFLNQKAKDSNAELELVFSDEYDYLLKTEKYVYYIKIIPNYGNQEITINNATKWQLRKSVNDTTLRYVENVEPLMRMDIPSIVDDKEAVKLYIIYPGAKTLLRYINECEMEFVSQKTDVYGTKVVTFNNLLQNRDSILK